MNLSETASILSIIAAYDRRTVGETDVRAWQAILVDIDVRDAAQAVNEHFTEGSDWLMPAEVRRRARAAAAARRVAEFDPLAVPDADPDDVRGYLTAVRQGRHRRPSQDELKPRPVLKALGAGMFHGVDEDGAA